jgi:5-methylthioadenosine/S-adenosylhomocysteine deaminase
VSILIKNAKIIDFERELNAFKTYDVLIEGKYIKKIARRIDNSTGEILDIKGLFLMPGFINTHNHAAMTLFRGYADDVRLMEWLNKRIWPVEAKFTPRDVYWGTLLAICEMIKSGTTTFADMYFHMDAVAKAVTESGMRASLCIGMTSDNNENDEKKLRASHEFIKKYHNSSDDRITCMYGPHAPFTCSPKFLGKTLLLAQEDGIPIHIHLAETAEEVKIITAKYGKSPTKYLYDLGFLEHHLLLAHSVNLTVDDVCILRNLKGGVSFNPVSNMKLGCGVAPIIEMLRKGLNVSMGTDGAGSATTLDMFDEMKAGGWMLKNDFFDPSIITSMVLLKMATEKGAKTLNLKKLGRIKEGYLADLICLDLNSSKYAPLNTNLCSLLAYTANGSCVEHSIINGKIVMKHRELTMIDEKTVLKQIEAINNKYFVA